MRRIPAVLVACVVTGGVPVTPAAATIAPPAVPDSPTDAQVFPDQSTPGSVRVSWNNSFSNGGSPLEYVVRAEPVEVGQVTECVTSSGVDRSACTFTGLQTNLYYRFTVFARNAVGLSGSTQAHAFLWPAPEIRTVKPVTERWGTWRWPAARVAWTDVTISPLAPLYEVSGYRVRTLKGGHQCARPQYDDRGSCLVKGLKHGKTYRFVVERVYTNDDPMVSKPSKPIVATKKGKR
jgi:hypothetical protein